MAGNAYAAVRRAVDAVAHGELGNGQRLRGELGNAGQQGHAGGGGAPAGGMSDAAARWAKLA